MPDAIQAARLVIASAARLSTITSFTLRADFERGFSGTREYGTLDVFAELPDRFVMRRVTSRPFVNGDGGAPTSDSLTQVIGFDGHRPLYSPERAYHVWAARPVDVPAERLTYLQADARRRFAELTLALLGSPAGARVEWGAPVGHPTRVDVMLDDERMTVHIDATTRHIARVGEWHLGDRRTVDGMSVPFTFERRVPDSRWFERWRVRSIHFNAPIDAKVFRAN